jgi:hypothetical protein
MDSYWLRALEAAEAAERTAARLRLRYGRQAEAHLDDANRDLKGQGARDATVEDVRRALRWTRPS